MRLGRVASAAALALVLAGCGGDAEAPPVEHVAGPNVAGRWRGEHDQVEFFPGGRLLLHQGAFRVAGRWEMVDTARVLLLYEGALATVPPGDYGVRVAGDRLTLCETDRPARCIPYARLAAGDGSAAPVVPPRDDPPRLAQPVRPSELPPEARAKEADGVLKQAYVLQLTYQAEYGHFAPALDSLRVVGWEPPPLRHFERLELVRADERLCIVLHPKAADLWPVHIDARGELGRGASC